MSRIDVLIGNELALHREVLAGAFRAMRPELFVHCVPHEELDGAVCDFQPLLVICSAVSTRVTDCSPAWIALYPNERDEAVVSVAGQRRTIPNASVFELLSVMDEVRAPPSPSCHGDLGPCFRNHSYE